VVLPPCILIHSISRSAVARGAVKPVVRLSSGLRDEEAPRTQSSASTSLDVSGLGGSSVAHSSAIYSYLKRTAVPTSPQMRFEEPPAVKTIVSTTGGMAALRFNTDPPPSI
jgi:hypothetical protein